MVTAGPFVSAVAGALNSESISMALLIEVPCPSISASTSIFEGVSVLGSASLPSLSTGSAIGTALSTKKG